MAVDKEKYNDAENGVGICREDSDASLFIGVDNATGDMVFEDELTGPHTLTELYNLPAVIDGLFTDDGDIIINLGFELLFPG